MATSGPARLYQVRPPIGNAGAHPHGGALRPATRPAGEDTSLAAPTALGLRRLANLLASYAPYDGAFQLRLPGTWAVRLSRLTTEATYATFGPAVCIAAQGAKVVMLGRDVVEYDPAHLLVFALDLPVATQVTRASRKEPYLGFVMDLDAARLAQLAARVYPRGIPKTSASCGLFAGRVTDGIVDATCRLLELQSNPEDTNLLGPLAVDEILIRLLRTPIGKRVAQIGNPKSGVQRIAAAVAWIRAHFAQPITVEDMAASIHMRTTSFHQRFKAVTSMSPLQYQKALRLHEARRLMLFQSLDAADACRRVGYVSPSQFSREYSRFFGSAPARDIARLRDEGFAPVDRRDTSQR
ncbi:MAG TPA: AraC family transcriptional regulator [Vicinamibacterales bacterium]|nr:AraC family transcriptional regulator [Vicinamibacterales bacterium]